MTLSLTARGDQSDVDVVYDLMALSPPADEELQVFADGYPSFLQSWERDIVAAVSGRRPGSGASHSG